MRCAYLDLYGFMEGLDRVGLAEGWDENIPAHKTLQELREIFKTEDPEFYREMQLNQEL